MNIEDGIELTDMINIPLVKGDKGDTYDDTEIKNRISTNEEDIKNLKQDNETNKSNILNLQSDNEDNKEDISEIKDKLSEQSTSILKNKEDIEELQNDNIINKKDISDIKQEQEEQNTRLSINEQDISNIKSKNTAQDNEIENINTKNIAQDNKLSEIETNIQSLQTDNTINKQDISNIKQEQTTQNANIEQNKSDIANINEEIATINEKDTSQDTNIETLTQRLTEKDNQIAELKAENEDLKADLSNSQIHGKASGEYVHLSDSAKMECSISPRGNSKQETRQGYNLLKQGINNNFSSNGVDVTYNSDGTIKVNGTATAKIYIRLVGGYNLQNVAFVLPIGRYYVNLSDTNVYLWLDNVLEHLGVAKTGGVINVSEDSNVTYAYLEVPSGTTFNNTIIKPMLVKVTDDSVTSLPYEPYGAMPSLEFESEIECVSSANVKVCNKNIEDNEFEFGDIDGTTGKLQGNNWCLRNKNFIRIKQNQKYIIRAVEYSGIKSINTACRYYDRNKKYLGSKYIGALENGAKEFTITDENVAFCKFVHLNSEEIPSDYTLKIQLEEDAETDYVEHEEQNYTVDMQEPFRAINDIRDCFVLKEDGKWYERHNIKRIVADGVNYLGSYIFDSGWFSLKNKELNAYIKNALKVSSIAILGNILCNKYKAITQNRMVNHNNMGVAIALSGEIYIKLDDATSETSTWTTDTVNAFLQENPLTIDYALAEPYYIECTETQTQQLQALQKAKTYKNITNITTDTIAILDVDYKRDLETYQKQQDDRITAIEQLLSTTATSAMLLDNVQSDLESEVK